jgi:hypothetical protein
MPGSQPKQKVSGSKSLVAGSLSGLIVAAATQPLDVARTMMQRDPKYYLQSSTRNTWGFWRDIIRESGVVGLWRGNVPSMLRVGVGAGM